MLFTRKSPEATAIYTLCSRKALINGNASSSCSECSVQNLLCVKGI